MKKLAIAGAALVGVVVLTAAAAAHAHGWGHGMMSPEKIDKFVTFRINDTLDDLKATDSQRSQILAIKDRLLPRGVELMKEHRQTHKQVMEMLSAPTVDKAALDSLVDQRIDGFRTFAHDVTGALVQIHDILSPDQRNQLQQKIKEHHRDSWGE